MDRDPFFSIITITLNSGKYLQKTIESVLAQDYSSRELLIVDGGSTDNTIEIIKSYGDSVRWISRKDRGISDAMNRGIKMAKGSIISHLHSDDIYRPHTLSHVFSLFCSQPEVMWICGGGEYIDQNGTRIKRIKPRKYSYRELKRLNILFHPSVFIRRAVFDRVGFFDLNLKYTMDYDMWLRIGKDFEPLQTDEILACFRVHSGSISSAENLKAFDEECRVRLKNFGTDHPVANLYNHLRRQTLRVVKRFNNP